MYAVIDIETGGFSKTKNAICEIAILVFNRDFELVREFQTLIAPYPRNAEVAEEVGQLVSYKDDAMAIHGIPMDDILKAPTAMEVAEEISDILDSNGVVQFIGHNIKKFDKPWVENFMRRFGHPSFTMDCIDTMELSKSKGNAKNGLEDLCTQYGIENHKAHRALGDCFATIELYHIVK